MVLSVPLYAKIVLEALSTSRAWMAAYFGSKYALSLAVSSTRRLVSDKVRLDGIIDKLFGWSRAVIWFF